MKEPTPNDYSFADVAATFAIEIAKGNTIHQKFTCDKCQSRQTIATPNKMFTTGICESCGHVTDIVKKGCNSMLIVSGAKNVDDFLKNFGKLFGDKNG